MIRFSFRQLSYFVATAEAGSTLRAAESLGVTQPAVSVAIGHLEEIFGQKLFVRRHAKGLDLTPFGRRKLAEIRRLLSYANTIDGAGEIDTLNGELEIGVFSTLAASFAPGLLSAFMQLHPRVRLRMREGNLDQLRRDLHGGVIELALLYDLGVLQDVSSVQLGSFYPYALLPVDHPLAKQAEVSIAELARERFVLIDLPHSRDYFLSLFRTVDVSPQDILPCASLETLRGMVGHGQGVSILITRPFGDHSHDGKALACRPIKDQVPPQRAIIASSNSAPMTSVAKAFVEVAKGYFEAHPSTLI